MIVDLRKAFKYVIKIYTMKKSRLWTHQWMIKAVLCSLIIYKQVQIAEKSIRRADENLRINREYYKGGLTTMTVLLDAQRQQQQALTQHTSAISEYLQAKTRYLILTGRRDYQR